MRRVPVANKYFSVRSLSSVSFFLFLLFTFDGLSPPSSHPHPHPHFFLSYSYSLYPISSLHLTSPLSTYQCPPPLNNVHFLPFQHPCTYLSDTPSSCHPFSHSQCPIPPFIRVARFPHLTLLFSSSHSLN
ncbi:hypothetical protein BKA57DRAFT_126011 [Linnemannia elongata]|nr:hypothetical protein BKA57DRAFT_126011 [Linnemannia elongata]